MEKKSLPEFFYWVKNNHVRKVAEQDESPAEKALRAERETQEHETVHNAGEEKNKQLEAGRARKKVTEDYMKLTEQYRSGKSSGSPLQRIQEFWWKTQMLSLMDIWNMGKEVVEFVKRKHERRSKGRYGDVGSRLPGVLGTEFDRVKQSA